MNEPEVLRYALKYISRGIPVFPIWGIYCGVCGCGDTECSNQGKHPIEPLVPHGCLDATLDASKATDWWNKYPEANIGILCGRNMFAVDVDPRHGGIESLAEIEKQHGKIPASTTVSTGGGGTHYYMAVKDVPVKGRIAMMPGIDIKSTGGYVVAPPSLHKSGSRYKFNGKFNGFAEAPDWLLELINGAKREKFDTSKALDGVPHGKRYYTLIGLAGKLRYAAVPYEAALEVMYKCADNCTPSAPREDTKAILTKAYDVWAEGPSEPVVLSKPPQSITHVLVRISESRYKMDIPEYGVTFDVDRLRREKHDLMGELSVKCLLAGAKTFDGSLSVADFNLSSERARSERAKILSKRADALGMDWYGFLEELCQKVIIAERQGEPSQDLKTIDKAGICEFHRIDNLYLPIRHPTVLFGDGGSAKSYYGLYIAGELAKSGIKSALFDWELAGEEHRDRLERLYSKIGMPSIQYVMCKNPLVDECERLSKIVTEHSIEYAVFDSIAFACDGPPEAAESASRYFRAVRQIGIGSLHIAHVTKTDFGDQKPFGSVFWHNGARATYFVKLVDETEENIKIGVFHKKSNLGRLQRPFAYEIRFEGGRTFFQKSDPASIPGLAEKMPLKSRMQSILRDGPKGMDDLVNFLDSKENTIRKTISRNSNTFTLLEGGKVGLFHSGNVPF